ncbi:S-adenosyl-L-methionine-dependent methyltransferase [Trichoderma gracile]
MQPHQSGDQSRHRKPKQRQVNPITTAVSTWITTTLAPGKPDDDDQDPQFEQLLSSVPKRFTIYEPLALLPTGSFASEPWASVLETCDETARNSLWMSILEQLSRAGQGKVTHLAVNEGIPLHKDGEEAENVLRSPSGLKMLFGDFGPAGVVGEEEEEKPTERDFEKAFWVGTKQNGIVQAWAPRWTMFSRGNVKEKARVLGFKRPSSVKRGEGGGGNRWAVDLYAGIGYFVFSYAKLGMRVLCWEINPWSVEGLRRGALANKWTVKVIQGEELRSPMETLLAGGEQIVVFLESNERAAGRIQEAQGRGLVRDVEHVNCGFLPTSEPVWKSAWEMTGRTDETAWLHLHENVGVEDIESRRASIQGMFEAWAAEDESAGRRTRVPRVEHVEQVKTFAPGVWHCVFDVCITGSISSSSISNNCT